MAQQHRNQQGQENQRYRWREGSYGDRNEQDRTRTGGSGWNEQSGRRGQYESQSFDQPYPPGFQDDYGSSQRATRYGSGSEGSGFGQHRGKGPKGYTRSDERLKEVICDKLTDDPNIDASDISVEVTSQVVKLTGTVDDRSTKYEVEELIERCGGVQDIDNQLRVRSRWSQSSQSQGGSTEATAGYGSGTGQPAGSTASQTTSQSAGK